MKRSSKRIVLTILALILWGSAALLFASSERDVLKLATTTSTFNSGLLEYILPDFEERLRATVRVTPVGTGQALALGMRGDVDVLLVHAPDEETRFVAEGYGKKRYPVMYNRFVLAGPQSDPARIRSVSTAAQAFRLVYDTKAIFVSRGDQSGTHVMEIGIWRQAGYSYEVEIDTPNNGWYMSVGAGMGDTLLRASQLQGYVLTDEGTYHAFAGDLNLQILFEGDPHLVNQYSVIPVTPERFPHVNGRLARAFVEWITSSETQSLISSFRRNENQLFIPNADVDTTQGRLGFTFHPCKEANSQPCEGKSSTHPFSIEDFNGLLREGDIPARRALHTGGGATDLDRGSRKCRSAEIDVHEGLSS